MCGGDTFVYFELLLQREIEEALCAGHDALLQLARDAMACDLEEAIVLAAVSDLLHELFLCCRVGAVEGREVEDRRCRWSHFGIMKLLSSGVELLIERLFYDRLMTIISMDV